MVISAYAGLFRGFVIVILMIFLALANCAFDGDDPREAALKKAYDLDNADLLSIRRIQDSQLFGAWHTILGTNRKIITFNKGAYTTIIDKHSRKNGPEKSERGQYTISSDSLHFRGVKLLLNHKGVAVDSFPLKYTCVARLRNDTLLLAQRGSNVWRDYVRFKAQTQAVPDF
ncbi:MAG: hypothetical protein GF398_18785 [Chitinivibrionales bacterium]|nr:hypothetical protein [Chitinivibrionales bacterium]